MQITLTLHSTDFSTDFQCKGSISYFVCHHRLYFSVLLLYCCMSHIESSVTFSSERQYSFKKFNIASKQKHSELGKRELKRYTLFMIKGPYCTKIHNCYMGALCQELSFVHLPLTAMMLSCERWRRGTTTQLLKHFSPRKITSPTTQYRLP